MAKRKTNSTPVQVGVGGLADQLANKKSKRQQSGRLTWATGVERTDEVSRKIISAGRKSMAFQPPQGEYDYPVEQLQQASGTSIFDPVLCELAYTWFCPPGGRILDPFAGGSVRGIVAAVLGRDYTGIDLRPEQVAANEVQAGYILTDEEQSDETVSDPLEMTPVQKFGDIYMKRDDLFEVAGVRGGKVRTCLALANGAAGLVTAGSRFSPQVNIVAHIANYKNVPCHLHTPSGELSPEVTQAKELGGEVIQHKPGYNSVIIARAREDAGAMGWTEIPFGMECQEAIEQTRRQVANIPPEVKRVVVPVGSGMSLSGILWGMKDNDLYMPVVGVYVGADPSKRLDQYAPDNWRDMVQLVDSGTDYHDPAENSNFRGVMLDPHYEAKCIPFIEAGDLFWLVGIRATVPQYDIPDTVANQPNWIVGDSRNLLDLVTDKVDFVFSCPPYYDLEVYSDDENDLSTIETYEEFVEVYRDIIRQSIELLKDDRFACFVVGDMRDKKGFYRNFVSDTIKAFQDAGAMLYNEAILITSVGSLPVRVNKPFLSSRKLGKSHQNVLVFCKGDPVKATQAIGEVDVWEPDYS